MATYYDRQKVLIEEFKQIDLNHDNQLSEEELYSCLDQKVSPTYLNKLGHKFDRIIGQQLWSRAVGQNQITIELNRFVDILIQAEDTLKGKIDTCRRSLETNYKQKREAEAKLQALNFSEQLNIYGVMDQSTLSVIVLAGRNFRHSDLSHTLDPFVVVRLDKQEFQTTLAQGANPEWLNPQTFYFNVLTGREDLQISVCDTDKFTNNAVIGRININLNNNNLGIKDQTKKELELELYDQIGNLSGGQIQIQVQWIYSRVRYLNDVLLSYKLQIQQQEEELQDYDYDLNCIYEPFLKWQYLYRGIKQLQPVAEKIPPKTVVSTAYTKRPFYDPHLEPFELFQISKLISASLMLFSLFSCFEKSQFLDIIIVCDFIILYQWNALNENKFMSLVILLTFSILLDLPWVIINSANWIFQPHGRVDREEIIESPTKRFVALMVILCLLLKVCLSVCFFILAQKLKVSTGNQKVQKTILYMDLQGSQVNLAASQLYLAKGIHLKLN